MSASLSPKDGTNIKPIMFPVEIPYSALTEGAYSFTGLPGENVSVALSFKPTSVIEAYPLGDNPTKHHLLLVRKVDTTVQVYSDGTFVGSTAGLTYTTIGELLSAALVWMFGSDKGYYSNLHVVDGSLLTWDTFFEVSPADSSLWVWKETIQPEYGAGGGYYPFSYDNIDLYTIFTGGTATASSLYSASYPASAAFDGVSGTLAGWVSGAMPANIKYQFADGDTKTLQSYSLQLRSNTTAIGQAPAEWTVQGSNDGTTWTTVDTRSVHDWTLNEKRTFLCDAPGAYEYYKMGVTETQGGGNYVGFSEWWGYWVPTPFGLGTDFSGNGNHWTVTGSQSVDTPTNNLPTINPLPDVGWTLGEGNLAFVGDADRDFMKVTLPCVNKCYWEVEWIAANGGSVGVIGEASTDPTVAGASYLPRGGSFQRFDDTAGTFGIDIPQACTLMLAYDNGNLWIGVDGMWSGDPVAFTDPIDSTITGTVYPFVYDTFLTNIPSGRFKFAEHELIYTPPVGFSPFGN